MTPEGRRDERRATLFVTLIYAAIMFLIVLWAGNVLAQEHGHRPQDMAIHEQFYSTWMMPDNRAMSCCNKEDCSPAESRFENGQWLAKKVDDERDFTPIPPQKVERDRDSPDGRSHLCGRRYGVGAHEMTVYCFVAGNGA